MRTVLGSLVIAGMATSGVLAASPAERWIHIRVDDADEGHGRVDIQVPIALVSGLLPVLKNETPSGGIHIDGEEIDLDDLRGYWEAVRNAKDGEYVTVRDHDSHVRIAKSSGNLLLSVDESAGGSRVRMKVPLPVVDAMLAGGNTVDLNALSKALEKAPSGELLTVDDEDSHVRIWIDDAPAPAREDAR